MATPFRWKWWSTTSTRKGAGSVFTPMRIIWIDMPSASRDRREWSGAISTWTSMSSHRGLDAQALDTLTARTRPAGRSFSLTLTERPHLPRSARLPRPHPRGVLNPPRRCEMPTSARRAEVGALRAAKTTPGVRARDGSQRQEGVLAVGVRDLRAAKHDDVLGLVALGELTSRPVRGDA